MPITRSDEYERVIDNSGIAESFQKRLNEKRYATMPTVKYDLLNPYAKPKMNTKASIQEAVEDLAKRTGLNQYINMVNAELLNQKKTAEAEEPTSLMQIPHVKAAVDDALNRREYVKPIDLLNALQQHVKIDDEIPTTLKNVFMDAQLKDYIGKHIDAYSQKSDVDYDLRSKKTEQHNTQSPMSMEYFNFTTTDGKQE